MLGAHRGGRNLYTSTDEKPWTFKKAFQAASHKPSAWMYFLTKTTAFFTSKGANGIFAKFQSLVCVSTQPIPVSSVSVLVSHRGPEWE